MKLPRFFAVLFLLLDIFGFVPPTQNATVATKRAAKAPQLNPNAYLPRIADWPLLLKMFRPWTNAALYRVNCQLWPSLKEDSSTYVIRAATAAWKIIAAMAKVLER